MLHVLLSEYIYYYLSDLSKLRNKKLVVYDTDDLSIDYTNAYEVYKAVTHGIEFSNVHIRGDMIRIEAVRTEEYMFKCNNVLVRRHYTNNYWCIDVVVNDLLYRIEVFGRLYINDRMFSLVIGKNGWSYPSHVAVQNDKCYIYCGGILELDIESGRLYALTASGRGCPITKDYRRFYGVTSPYYCQSVTNYLKQVTLNGDIELKNIENSSEAITRNASKSASVFRNLYS